MRRPLRMLGLAALAAFLVVLATCALVVHRGISARAQPGAIETALARGMRHLAIPAGARKMANPVPDTPEVLASARAHFADHCAGCHGNDGKGLTDMGRNLYPKAPDMTGPTQSLADGEIFFIIKNGVRLTGMPAWGDDSAESDRASWELVRFIRHLPSITPEELREMAELNQISPHEAREREEIDRFLRGEDAPQEHDTHRH